MKDNNIKGLSLYDFNEDFKYFCRRVLLNTRNPISTRNIIVTKLNGL